MVVAEIGRSRIRVHVKGPFKVNTCELEFTHT